MAVDCILALEEEVLGILAVGAGLAEAHNLLAVGHEGVRIAVEGVGREPGDRSLEVGWRARLEELEVERIQSLENVVRLADFLAALGDLDSHLEELTDGQEDLDQRRLLAVLFEGSSPGFQM